MFYNFAQDNENNLLPLYSYGTDIEIIIYNLKLYNFSYDSKFFKWSDKFYDIKEIIKDKINTNNYTSGTLYKAYDLIPSTNVSIHNALWDSLSIFLTLNYMYQNNLIN